MLPVPLINAGDFEGGAPAVNEDAYADPDAGYQRKAADQAPPDYPLNLHGALQLSSGHEEEWFCKCIQYKRHQEARITSLL